MFGLSTPLTASNNQNPWILKSIITESDAETPFGDQQYNAELPVGVADSNYPPEGHVETLCCKFTMLAIQSRFPLAVFLARV